MFTICQHMPTSFYNPCVWGPIVVPRPSPSDGVSDTATTAHDLGSHEWPFLSKIGQDFFFHILLLDHLDLRGE